MKNLVVVFSLLISVYGYTQNDKLTGKWEGNGELIEFSANSMNYYGAIYPCTFTTNVIIIHTDQGNVQFEYLLEGNQLTLKGNGQSAIYVKEGTKLPNSTDANSKNTNSNNGGSVDKTMVGKWCYVDVNSTYSGGSSTSECVRFMKMARMNIIRKAQEV